MLKILIAEDEEPIANLIRMNLNRAGYQCIWAPDGEEAADRMAKEPFDLILLDIMLPGINGYELMEYAKELGMPVIFLTALGNTEHKVKGLKMGADDYLTKPFLEVFDVVIDTSSRTVLQNGTPIALTMKEFDLLLLLARNRNIALYRETIYENVWGGEYLGQSRTVDLHIQRLKKKLKWENEITAVYKVGYRLEA